jgi:hypothetical protein
MSSVTHIPTVMVERGLAHARSIARTMIAMGHVSVDGETVRDLDHPGEVGVIEVSMARAPITHVPADVAYACWWALGKYLNDDPDADAATTRQWRRLGRYLEVPEQPTPH